MMFDWGSSTLDSTTVGIVGISYCCTVLCIALCWCWQCLLTVGGNLLPHTVTPLDVTAVAWCCRRNQDFLHPAECPPASLQTSQWQWTSSVFPTWHCTGSCSSLFTSDKCFHRYLTACYGWWTGVKDKCDRWYYTSYWIRPVPCQSMLHIAVVFN